MIQHFVPTTLKEALKILDERDCYIMAGGTDLMVQKHRGSGLLPNFDKDILYVMNIKELDYIKTDAEGNLRIGAMNRYCELLNSSLVPDIFKTVFKEIASPNIRNMATLVGNIANASPAGDSLLPLNLFNARVVLSSVKGNREVLVEDFIQGVRKIDRQKNELITEVIIPSCDLNFYYRKVGSRKAESITKVSIMGGYKIEGGKVKDLRIVFGSISVKVVRNHFIEEKYQGKSVNELRARIDDIINEYDHEIKPITDQRSTMEYRKKVAKNLLRDFLKHIK